MKRREFIVTGAKAFLAGCLVLALPGRVVAGGIPVFDAANTAQGVLEAIRALKSNINEALMLANQVQQLANDVRNLTSLDFSIVDEFSNEFRELYSAVGSVQGLMQDFNALQQKFENLYPDFNNLEQLLSGETILQETNKWLDESREMIKGASLTGAKALESLPSTQSQLDKLLVDSQGSVGILQAAQAGNQISALVAGNLMQLSAQLATYHQAHMSYMQKSNQHQAVAINRLKAMQEKPVPSQVKGVPLRPF